jgi:hypothetical protein
MHGNVNGCRYDDECQRNHGRTQMYRSDEIAPFAFTCRKAGRCEATLSVSDADALLDLPTCIELEDAGVIVVDACGKRFTGNVFEPGFTFPLALCKNRGRCERQESRRLGSKQGGETMTYRSPRVGFVRRYTSNGPPATSREDVLVIDKGFSKDIRRSLHLAT